MIKKIFLIHAPARSGKNTCAEAMVDYYKSKNKRCCIVAFGDVVKFTLEKYYGVTDYHVKCEVIRVFEAENTIRVKVAEGEWCSGNIYTVDADDFEPVYKKAVIV